MMLHPLSAQRQSESEADACRDGVVTDVLDILSEKLGSFAADELIVLL